MGLICHIYLVVVVAAHLRWDGCSDIKPRPRFTHYHLGSFSFRASIPAHWRVRGWSAWAMHNS